MTLNNANALESRIIDFMKDKLNAIERKSKKRQELQRPLRVAIVPLFTNEINYIRTPPWLHGFTH